MNFVSRPRIAGSVIRPAGTSYPVGMARERDIIADLHQVLLGVAGVRFAMIFGSVARHDESIASDVDLAVDASADVDLFALSAALSRATGREVELIRLQDAGVPLLEE